MRELTLTALITFGLSGAAFAQVPYDPPTAVRPPPNVLVLLDATRTTLINGENCRGICHVEGSSCGGHGGEYDCNIYRNGETRLQLARRVLTGGWGWNTGIRSDSGEIADARVSSDGVMDKYKVRWGVAFYDGVGTRMVLDPTDNNEAAQRAVIDFGLPTNENQADILPGLNFPSGQLLNSWLPWFRSTNCCSNSGGTARPEMNLAYARQARALEYIRRYWQPGDTPGAFPGVSVTGRWATTGISSNQSWPAGNTPQDSTVIDADLDNVLVGNPANRSCRRNFTIMLLDGHGGGAYDHDGVGSTPALGNGPAAGAIYQMPGGAGANLGNVGGRNLSNQVFAIHFGVQDKHHADRVADYGFDGVACNNPTAAATPNGCSGTACQGCDGLFTAFEGAPGGAITDLTPMLAAFSAVMGMVLDGTYVGASPAISRFGDFLIRSQFEIRSCAGISPHQCNIGRPGTLTYQSIAANGSLGLVQFDAGQNLESRAIATRDLITGWPRGTPAPNDTNCSVYATCPAADRTAAQTLVPNPAAMSPRPTWNAVATQPPEFSGTGLTYNDFAFLRGDPIAKFANGVFRADFACNLQTAGSCCSDLDRNGFPDSNEPRDNRDPYAAPCLDRSYKLMDIANSKPVIVGAPAGVGEDLGRWNHFLDVSVPRSGVNVANYGGTARRVRNRDQIVYIGGNDGFVHAFLAGIANTSRREPGKTVSYDVPTACSGSGRALCAGQEIWGFSPRLLQPSWSAVQGGHFHMVDGSPVVSDVLFTKRRPTPNNGSATQPYCNEHDTRSSVCADWEYRTVLLQCLGAGGPGCFALDVTNPYDPQVLWERSFARMSATSGTNPPPTIRATTTSRPQIVKLRRRITVGAVVQEYPYYAAVLGGGMNEQNSTGTRQGSAIVVGIEDGEYTFSTGAQAADADFAGSPTCLDADNDSYVDTCYMVTQRASVYKIRFVDGNPYASDPGANDGILMEKFFDGRAAIATAFTDLLNGAANARAYGRVAASFDTGGAINLFYGTGNFEAISNTTEQNYFFKLRDTTPDSPPAAYDPNTNMSKTTGACDPISVGSQSFGVSTVAGRGVLRLTRGEKILFDPLVAQKRVFFTSYLPHSSLCLPGRGYLYGIDFATCRNGLDTNPNSPGVESDRIDFGEASGLPTAPIFNEETGTVYTPMSDGVLNTTAGVTQNTTNPQEPIIKLWWREVFR